MSNYYFGMYEKMKIELLSRVHPRVILSPNQIDRYKEKAEKDEYTKVAIDNFVKQAYACSSLPATEYKYKGRRLLEATREGCKRLQSLAIAYLFTGDESLLYGAEREIEAALAVESWNPNHFLDVAEMAMGLGLAYDWLYDFLSEELRLQIRRNLIQKAFEPSFNGGQVWISGKNNWNQVCHAGLGVAALAIGEDEPEWLERIISRAVDNLPVAMKQSYYPAGVYPEGPMYWGYGTTYNVLILDAMHSALGTDFGLSEQVGFSQTALYEYHMHGPDGYAFNYYDCNNGHFWGSTMLWLANRFGLGHIADIVKKELLSRMRADLDCGKYVDNKFSSTFLLWDRGLRTEKEISVDLDYFGRGVNPVVSFRSSFDDDNAVWLAAKGGNNTNGHNHMDAGTFIFAAEGVRWVSELGMDNYTNLEENKRNNLWDPSQRYNFLRLGPFGHSTINIADALQPLGDIDSPVVGFYSSPQRAHAVIDTSDVWKSHAASVKRGVALLGRKTALIQDEILGCSDWITWQMISEADIEIESNKAFMSKNEKRYIAEIIEPKGASFQKMSLKPVFPEENKNAGFSKIGIRTKGNGDLRIVVLIHSVSDNVCAEVIPLSEWKTQ